VASSVRIEEAQAMSEDVVAAVGLLVAQLSPRTPAPTAAELQAIVDSPWTRLLLARDADGGVVGMLTLALYRIPTGLSAWIEDVVVDERARGRGIGEKLTRTAVRLAGEAGAKSVDLTSRPHREAANRLYRRLGFTTRETNLYRFELSRKSTAE
jgi:ribosomal protein S18 acetylase RimI-like enzyme